VTSIRAPNRSKANRRTRTSRRPRSERYPAPTGPSRRATGSLTRTGGKRPADSDECPIIELLDETTRICAIDGEEFVFDNLDDWEKFPVVNAFPFGNEVEVVRGGGRGGNGK
jgi:hypothetical protein